jgi:hypothetical protein
MAHPNQEASGVVLKAITFYAVVLGLVFLIGVFAMMTTKP